MKPSSKTPKFSQFQLYILNLSEMNAIFRAGSQFVSKRPRHTATDILLQALRTHADKRYISVIIIITSSFSFFSAQSNIISHLITSLVEY